MKTVTKMMMGAGAVSIALLGIAFATPIVNLASPIVATGTDNAPTQTKGVGQGPDGEWFDVALTTDRPATISIQDAAFAPGGQNGWHAHPGLVAVTLLSGSIEWFNGNCESKIYNAGDAWTEGSNIHAFRVLGTVNVHLMATFIVAKGAALRIDEAAPACAAGLGL